MIPAPGLCSKVTVSRAVLQQVLYCHRRCAVGAHCRMTRMVFGEHVVSESRKEVSIHPVFTIKFRLQLGINSERSEVYTKQQKWENAIEMEMSNSSAQRRPSFCYVHVFTDNMGMSAPWCAPRSCQPALKQAVNTVIPNTRGCLLVVRHNSSYQILHMTPQ